MPEPSKRTTKTILKSILKWTFILVLLIVAICLVLVGPIDRTPLNEQPFYHTMMARMDSFQLENHHATYPVRVGRSKISITPDHAMPMAGYGPRDYFTEIHDSIFARVLSIDNGSFRAYIVSVDLLIFPPTLKEAILNSFHDDKDYIIYFSATHTHSSVGGWDPGFVGEFTMGDYDPEWVKTTAEVIVTGLKEAAVQGKKATISYMERQAGWYVFNHLNALSKKDGMIRGLSITCEDQSEIILVTYSAHATLLSGNYTILSGDYPAAMIKALEEEVDFAMFLGGMVGSHRIKGMKRKNFEFVEQVGQVLANQALQSRKVVLDSLPIIRAQTIKIEHGPSQLRLTRYLKLRDWFFRKLVRPLDGEIRVMQIGNILFIGASCDFSGEIAKADGLHELAASKGLYLIITSFNGEYTGYITQDEHYDRSKNETVRILNWVGPYFGSYYSEMIRKIIEKSSNIENKSL